MEQHRIIDFHYNPDEFVVWVVLDRPPRDTWVAALDGALDDEVHRVRPAVADGDRVYLRVDGLGEYDALTVLSAYVDAANATVSATPTRSGDGRRPRRTWF